MTFDDSCLRFTEPGDALASLRELIRRERQRAHLTQSELAHKSNVPATTISRLERTGLSSTDAFVRILFALDALESFQDFLKERLRLSSFPKTLSEVVPAKPIARVRHRKGERS